MWTAIGELYYGVCFGIIQVAAQRHVMLMIIALLLCMVIVLAMVLCSEISMLLIAWLS